MAGVSMIPIPAGTPASVCKGCGQRIYFAPHPTSGRGHPVSVKHEEAIEPTPLVEGAGISHFADCPNANDFRSKKT